METVDSVSPFVGFIIVAAMVVIVIMLAYQEYLSQDRGTIEPLSFDRWLNTIFGTPAGVGKYSRGGLYSEQSKSLEEQLDMEAEHRMYYGEKAFVKAYRATIDARNKAVVEVNAPRDEATRVAEIAEYDARMKASK